MTLIQAKAELNKLLHSTGEEAYNIYCEKEYYDPRKDDYVTGQLANLPFNIVSVNHYDKHVRDAVSEGYGTIPVSIIVEYKGLYLRSEALMGSYVDEWQEWTQVFPKQVITTIYE